MDSNASLLIYPNPVKANTIFTLEIKDMPGGRYSLAILTSTGGTVKNEELIVGEKLNEVFRHVKQHSSRSVFYSIDQPAVCKTLYRDHHR